MSAVVLAVDPGDVHCGVAVFVAGACRWTGEMGQDDLMDWLGVGAALYAPGALAWDAIVCESFKLYPGKASAQSWSTMATVEMIGKLREYCRHRPGTEFVLQPASIKKGSAARLRAHGVVLTSRGSGGHAKDAELHGWHYLEGVGAWRHHRRSATAGGAAGAAGHAAAGQAYRRA